MSVKEHAKNTDTWIRGLFIIVFALIFYVLCGVIWLLVLLQFLFKVLTGKLNENLSTFSQSLTRFAFQILLYITFQSEERPFPFSPWPSTGASLPEPAESEQATEVAEDKEDDSKSE